MTNILKSDLTRNFSFGFVIGAIALAFTSGDATMIPAAIAGVIS